MPAGGFRTFVAGETLDEDKINDYLMQGILVFGGTAARGSAITSPVHGQWSFMTDTDSLQYFDGSAWVDFSTGGIEFEYVVIAGGGGGGDDRGDGGGGGGGGAGGYISSVSGESSGGGSSAQPKLSVLEGESFTVTIGAGGTGVTTPANGSNTTCGPVVATGGGRGGWFNTSFFAPQIGGSGGGGNYSTYQTGASGTANQGYAGGNGQTAVGGTGGGGGGADEVGANGTGSPQAGGDGGDGISSSITGSAVTRAGGGGGGANAGTPGAGGAGGGGAGALISATATSGTANTGGGGGAGGTGGSGGSGVVILRYPASVTLTIGAGLTSSTTTSGNQKITTFTAGTDTVTV